MTKTKDEYGDKSNHQRCKKCGWCRDCKDGACNCEANK